MLQTGRSCYLVRKGTEIRQMFSLPESQETEGEKALCKIDCQNGEFSLSPLEETIWLVARTMKTKYGSGFIVKEGDLIKLGRVCFKVTMLRGISDNEVDDNTQDSEEFDLEIPNERESAVCKICLTSDVEEGNPLISPCKCAGSMKFIHLQCLRHWIDSRMLSRCTENCITHSWKSIDCEICKSLFPLTVEGVGKATDLLQISKPDAPFLLLEGVGNDKNSNRGVHLISVIGNGGVTLGRGHEADVRISDISVSRCHATIKFIDGVFVIEDNNSKFGTLVKYDNKLVIKQANSAVVQIGRTVVSLSTKAQQPTFEITEITN